MAQREPSVLFKLEEAWGLPSLSIPCIQAEAYLRLADIPFAVERCTTPAASPTGCVPSLDTPSELVGVPVAEAAAGPSGEHAAAVAVIDHLRRSSTDLDSGLAPVQRADLRALGALLEHELLPALLYSTWLEDDAFKRCTRDAFGKHLPFPLRFITPLVQRRAVRASLGGADPAHVYKAASGALEAFEAKLAQSGGPYVFGDAPTSLDALLFGALAYLSGAPVVHSELRARLGASPSLRAFLSHVSRDAFSSPPPLSTESADFSWSQWDSGDSAGGSGSESRKEKRAAESELNRKGRIWLACAAAAIVGYVVLGGHYVQFGFDDDEYDDEEFDE